MTLSSSAVSATEGQSVILTANISPVLATGTVTFYNGTTNIGTASVQSASGFNFYAYAQLQTTFSTVGMQSITAKYSGDTFFNGSTSSAIDVGIYSNDLTATSTALKISNMTPDYDTNLTLTATVSPASATGTVSFYNGSALVGTSNLSGGVATETVSFPAGGSYNLTAIYSGDFTNATSTSATLNVNVTGPLVTSTYLQISTTSIAAGDNVTLTATMTPANATGTVTFMNGSTPISTVNVVNGTATLVTAFSETGQLQIQADFNADSAYEASNSNIVGLYVTGDTPTSVGVSFTIADPIIGYSTTLIATVTPSGATGNVSFYDDSTWIGNGQVMDGVASFTYIPESSGARTINAVYSGDPTYISSSGSAILNVSNTGSTATSTSLVLSNNSIYTGDTETMTAMVTPANATGQVTFMSNGTPLGTALVTNGTATFSTVFNSEGEYSLTAVYDGDLTYAPSTSEAQILYVSDPGDTRRK